MDGFRKDFPTIRSGNGIYLDSACQSLRPDSVIRAVSEYYEEYPACGGRSVHSMATRVSVLTDETRESLAKFFGTENPDCYVFTKNCTEALNTVAFGLNLRKGDVVVTTDTEHNSNHVPWLTLSEIAGVGRRMSVSAPDGSFDIESFKSLMDRDVKAVSVCHVSNVTGCSVPLKEIAEIAHDYGAAIIADGAQAAPHLPINLEDLDVDAYCFSMHKMLGPSGMGILYGKEEFLEKLRPLTYGGGAVGMTRTDAFTVAPVPERFEAGLHNYAGIAGTKAALEYLTKVGMREIERHDRMLMRKIFDGIQDISRLRVVGPEDPDLRGSVFSFNIDGLCAHDIGMMLDSAESIMIRSGMHCAHPFYETRGMEGSARASTYLYNTQGEIDKLTSALRNIAETFGRRLSQHHRVSAGQQEASRVRGQSSDGVDAVARRHHSVLHRDGYPIRRKAQISVQSEFGQDGILEPVQQVGYRFRQIGAHFRLVRSVGD